MYKQILDKLKRISMNVYGIAGVGFFIQFGVSIFFCTGNIYIAGAGKAISEVDLIGIRSFTESVPILSKLISGYLSDYLGNRKSFLSFGYGAIIACKGLTALLVFPGLNLGNNKWFYIIPQIIDRFANSIRDAPRDSLVTANTVQELLPIAFTLRKGLASVGSVLAGIFCYYYISKYKSSTILGLNSGAFLYLLAMIPIILASVILWFSVKDVQLEKTDYSAVNVGTENFSVNYLDILFYCVSRIITLVSFYYFPPANMPELLNTVFSFVVNAKFSIITSSTFIIGRHFPIYAKPMAFITIILAIYNNYDINLLIKLAFSLVVMLLAYWVIGNNYLVLSYIFAISYMLMEGLGKFDWLNIIRAVSNIKNHSKLIKTTALAFILIFAKMNDTCFFTNTLPGWSNNSNTLMFSLLYTSIAFSSLLFSWLMTKGQRISRLVVVFALFGANLLLTFKSTTAIILSNILIGIYNGGIDSVLGAHISELIDKPNLRGTIFGIFYFISGIASIGAALLFTKFLNGYSLATKAYYGMFISSLAIIGVFI